MRTTTTTRTPAAGPSRHRVVAATLAGGTALTLAACGTGLSADSSCADYMTAPRSQQDSVVSALASELGAANAVTPLGRPNVDYLCAGDGTLPLREAVSRTG